MLQMFSDICGNDAAVENKTIFLPYASVLAAAYYLLPLLMNDTGSAMFILLACMPLIVFFSSFMCCRRHRFQWVMIVLTVVLFLPSMYFYFNATAFGYSVFYAIVSAAGCFAGEFLS